MSTVLSSQVNKIDSADFDMLKPNESHGRVRTAYFDYTTPSAGLSNGDIVALCEIPKGARVLGGKIVHGALGTSVVGKVGITGDDDKYVAASTAMATAGTVNMATTHATNYGAETTAKERIILTLSGADPDGDIVISGHVEYVVD